MIQDNLITKNNIKNKLLKSSFKLGLRVKLKKALKLFHKDIKNKNKTVNVLNENYNFNFDKNQLKKFLNYKTIVLIGMGGSILGAEAIYNFLERKIKKKFYFIDNLDSKKINQLKKQEKINKNFFLIISKSGNTIETLSNFFTFSSLVKKNSKNIIIITEKKNNYLYNLSRKFNLFYIEHKKHIGGRYSVLSEVGIVPAYLMGINIQRLRSNITDYLKGKDFNFLKESVLKLANLLKTKKINNLVFICYSTELEKFLFWCQQLIAESLGKKDNGFLPTISTGPKDHHSLLQLYLDGPKNKLFHIFSTNEKTKNKVEIKSINKEKNILNKKNLHDIKLAQKNALISTLKKNKIPFREFIVKNTNEEVLGKLFSYFIIETILIGNLTKINPFNQPAVEQVKKLTKKLLS